MSTMLPMADPRQGPGEPPPFERIAVAGYGLIGASLGLAIKARWPSALLIAIDRKDVIETAMRMGAADVGGDDLVLAAEAQLVVLAAPILTNNSILAELADHVPGSALVTDVGSTKRQTVAAARVLPERLRFIGGHPLAGAAVGGIEAARPDLFNGRPWLLTPGNQHTADDAARLQSMLEALGAAVRTLTPETHDRLTAYISHLPQLVATSLMQVVGAGAGDDGLALAGRGLRDTTRLASSPAAVWRDILVTNSDNIARAMDEMVEVLRRVKGDGPPGDDFTATFDSAAAWKRALEQHFEGP